MSTLFWIFCHRRSDRVVRIRSWWIMYLRYSFPCIQRGKVGENLCGFSPRDTDFCVWVRGTDSHVYCERKEGRKEEDSPWGCRSYTQEYYLQPLGNTGPWLCLVAKLLFCLLWQPLFFFLHVLTSLVKCALWNSEKPGSLKVFYRQEADRGHALFSLKIWIFFGLMK